MRHCCEHAVDAALPEAALGPGGGDECRRQLDALLEVDALAARISCEFAEVLTRYDCGQTYSIAHRCDDCKVTIPTIKLTTIRYIQKPISKVKMTIQCQADNVCNTKLKSATMTWERLVSALFLQWFFMLKD